MSNPWMPIYWGDYFKNTLNFSTFQHGCYCLLIGAYWENSGPLLDDLDDLARICRTSRDKLARYGNPVLAKFYSNGTLLYHSRVEFELLRSSNRQAAAIANGRAGGLAKSYLTTPTSTPEETVNNNSSFNGKVPGKKNGQGNGHVTIKSPDERLARFQKWLAIDARMGWIAVSVAADPSHPQYGAELERCRERAREMGKGWPKQWPSPLTE